MSRNALTLVSTKLADDKFRKRCELLDAKIEESLRIAFKNERIGQERLNRIVDRFCNEMLGTNK